MIIHTMNVCQPKIPISDLLRRTIAESGVSYNALQRETGVTRASIMRFVRGDQSIRLDMADRLAAYFGLELRSEEVMTDGQRLQENRHSTATARCRDHHSQGVRLARWKRKGKEKTAYRTDRPKRGERIRDESGTYVARYRDGDGIVVEVSTGCRDKSAAEDVLADLERKAERVRSGLLTPAEARTAEHLATPIGEHFDAYLNALAAAGSVPMHRSNVKTYLNRLAADCGFGRLADLKPGSSREMACQGNQDAAGRLALATLTGLRSSPSRTGAPIRASAGLSSNPFKGVPKADEKADPRRRRRSMTEAELVRLLDVARGRPLLEALTVRRGKRKGQAVAKVRPEVRERLDAVGRERALIYKTLVLTGLRKNELATLTVAQLRLDGPTPYVELDAADEKNREGNDIVYPRPTSPPTFEPGSATSSPHSRRKPAGEASRFRAGCLATRPVFDDPRWAGPDLRSRPEARRHRQARRAGPHSRRACIADDVRHALGQGRGAVADGSSRHAAFRPEAHGERLHRSAVSWTSVVLSTPCRAYRSTRGPTIERERAPSDRDRRFTALAPLPRSLH